MLTKAQIDEYNEIGAIVVPDVLTPDEVQRLREVTDELRRARARRDRRITRSTTSRTATRRTTRGCGASRRRTCTTRTTPR